MESVCVVTGYKELYKSGYNLQFKFTVNKETYYGESGKIFRCNYNKFLGKHFPVVYSKKNPNRNIILLSPNDFKRWDKTFPDSLNYINECFKKK